MVAYANSSSVERSSMHVSGLSIGVVWQCASMSCDVTSDRASNKLWKRSPHASAWPMATMSEEDDCMDVDASASRVVPEVAILELEFVLGAHAKLVHRLTCETSTLGGHSAQLGFHGDRDFPWLG